MRNIDRELQIREQILLGILAAIIIGAAYFYLVHKPVKEGIALAKEQISQLTEQKQALEAQIAMLERMQSNSQDPVAKALGYMPSYNYNTQEIKMLNNILQMTEDYTVSFSGLSRNGDQVRRTFSLRFRVHEYADVEKVIHELTKTEIRCLIGNMSCSAGNEDTILVDVAATFYETMVEGEEDSAIASSQ